MNELKKPTKIYSAIVNGYSVGVTFDRSKAEAWISRSDSRDKRVCERAYVEPAGLTYAVNYQS